MLLTTKYPNESVGRMEYAEGWKHFNSLNQWVSMPGRYASHFLPEYVTNILPSFCSYNFFAVILQLPSHRVQSWALPQQMRWTYTSSAFAFSPVCQTKRSNVS